MKRITFVTEDISFKAGVERVLTIIANELSKEYEVTIISLFNEKEENAYYVNEKIKLIKVFKKFKRKNLKYVYYFLMLLFRLYLLNFKTDDFIVTEVRTFPFFTFMRKKSKLMVWEHNNSFVSDDMFGKLYNIGRRSAAKYADKIIVLTDKDKNNYQEVYRISDNRIIRIYNPVEMTNQTHDYDLNSKKILSIGRSIKTKGFDYLIDIAKKVFEKHKDWVWHIYGVTDENDILNNLICSNGLENNVISKGFTKNIQELYKDYSFFVLTSRFEGFPMVNIEAHAAKLPIVSFDCPCGPSEMIKDGENGYIVPCFEIEKMAEKINYLIENPKERQRLSTNTSKDKDKLKMDTIIKEWKNIL